MGELISGALSVATIVFAVSSMLAVGCSYALRDILEPLKNVGGVVRALIANFILVPIVAVFVARALELEPPLAVGLVIVGSAAGAPFLIKLTTSAGADVGLSATLLVLLVPATILYLPLVTPMIAPSASLNPMAIATPLVLTMLLPIFAGMALRASRRDLADRLKPIMAETASYALIALVVLAILANLPRTLDMTLRPIVAAGLLILAAFGIGYALGGRSAEERAILGLATGQRNLAAAIVLATQAIGHPDTITMVVISALVGLALLFPIAAKLRVSRAPSVAMDEVGSAIPAEVFAPEFGAEGGGEIEMSHQESAERAGERRRPNILIVCVDQWQAHMDVPKEVSFPALERLEAEGVSLDHHYCTVPICTPSRSVMWTGMHAVHTGLVDNTNFAWGSEMSTEIKTIGHMLREQGYYTAFKGKWHLSTPPRGEYALEPYGFSDYQQWGDVFGTPLQGAQVDGATAFETVDWLEHKGAQMDEPWLLVSNLINPHDIMFLQTDPIERPHPNGSMVGLQSSAQTLGFFEERWDVKLPDNFDDDLRLQPEAVRAYKEGIDLNYGRVPDDREDLWLIRRNYLINCMRLADAEMGKIVDALDRLELWDDTVVIFTSDHGEMNGAHRMTQKGAIHFDEAVAVNLTACVPGGPKGERSGAIGSHLDLAPTLLEFAGLDEEEIAARYPELKGRSLRSALLDPSAAGPRGSADAPGDGALFGWDGLNMLDHEWGITGALSSLTEMGEGPPPSRAEKRAALLKAGERYGAPDFSRRTFYRAVVDGSYKLVRWFSPEEYGNPRTLDELIESGDVTLHDLLSDPGELQNIGHPSHPDYHPALIEQMLAKLHALVEREIGEERRPFSLDLFGTREVRYRERQEQRQKEQQEEPRKERETPRA